MIRRKYQVKLMDKILDFSSDNFPFMHNMIANDMMIRWFKKICTYDIIKTDNADNKETLLDAISSNMIFGYVYDAQNKSLYCMMANDNIMNLLFSDNTIDNMDEVINELDDKDFVVLKETDTNSLQRLETVDNDQHISLYTINLSSNDDIFGFERMTFDIEEHDNYPSSVVFTDILLACYAARFIIYNVDTIKEGKHVRLMTDVFDALCSTLYDKSYNMYLGIERIDDIIDKIINEDLDYSSYIEDTNAIKKINSAPKLKVEDSYNKDNARFKKAFDNLLGDVDVMDVILALSAIAKNNAIKEIPDSIFQDTIKVINQDKVSCMVLDIKNDDVYIGYTGNNRAEGIKVAKCHNCVYGKEIANGIIANLGNLENIKKVHKASNIIGWLFVDPFNIKKDNCTILADKTNKDTSTFISATQVMCDKLVEVYLTE